MASVMSVSLRSHKFKRFSRRYAQAYRLSRLTEAPSRTRVLFGLHFRRYASGVGGPTPGQIDLQGEDVEDYAQTERRKIWSIWSPTLFKMFESAATTFASILVLGLAGYGYHRVCRF